MTISGALPFRFFGVKTYAGMIIGLPAPWPVGFVVRSDFGLVSLTLSTAATSPSLKYQRTSSLLLMTSSKSRFCANSGNAVSANAKTIKALRMGRDVTLTKKSREGVTMRRSFATGLILLLLAGAAY